MKRLSASQATAIVLVVVAVIVNAVSLLPEISISRFDLNDSVFHYTMASRMAQTFQSGENPLDFWVSEWTLGYPVSRTYQPLAHLFTAALYIALAKTVSLMTLFVWIRYLLVALLPVTVYFSARQLGMAPLTAAASAMISPLISTNGLFGIEYGSYVWQGSGLYTQAAAMHLLFIGVGLTFKSMRNEGSGILAGIVLGLTSLTHFVYGYIGALTACLIAAIPNTLPGSRRMIRLVTIAFAALCTSAFELVPALIDLPYLNHSRWEPLWKWNSFGAAEVLRQLSAGNLMDFGRLPVLTLLVLLGAVFCLTHRRASLSEERGATPSPALNVALFGGGFWVLLYFGRTTWGGFFSIFATPDIPLHRLIGGVHFFFVLLGGLGLASVWRWIQSRKFVFQNSILIAVTALVLGPAIRERWEYLARNRALGEENAAAFQTERSSVDRLISNLRNAPGRVYPGTASGWGQQFRVGYVPIYAILSTNHIPTVAFLYHAMALTSDIMVSFDERNPAHYELFNVSTVVSDGRALPSFVHETDRIGRFRIGAVASGGYFGVVRVPYAVRSSKEIFYDGVVRWMESDWLKKGAYLRMDFADDTLSNLPQLAPGQPLPELTLSDQNGPPGIIESEHHEGEEYGAVVRVTSPAYVLFKMTYHPNWRATIDGSPVQPQMLSPGFIGVPVGQGEHRIEMRYVPGPLKPVLLVSGLACLGVIPAVARRRRK